MNKRSHKSTIAELLGGLPFRLDSSRPLIRERDGDPFSIVLSISDDFTYSDLDRLASVFRTRDIRITDCYHGYDGDHDSSGIYITIPGERADEFLLTAEETKHIEAKIRHELDTQRLKCLTDDARALEKKLKGEAGSYVVGVGCRDK